MEKVKKAALSVLAALAIICLTVGFMFSLPAATAYADGTGSNVSTDTDTGTGSGEGTGEGTGENTETDPAPDEGTTEGVATIGETSYATLQAAIDAATSGQTVTLIKDVTENIKTAADDVITLDLNGNTISGTDYVVRNYGNLTINGEGTVALDTSVTDRNALRNEGGATLTINGGKYTTGNVQTLYNKGTLTITGGEFESAGSKKITAAFWSPGAVTISGDTKFTNTADGNGSIGIYGGSITIESGTFTNAGAQVLAISNSTLAEVTIKGGTFTSTTTGNASLLNVKCKTLNIEGGTFTAPNAQTTEIINYSAGDIAISGGSFNADIPGDYIAENAMLVSDGENGYVVGDAQKIATEQQKDYYVANGIAYESLPAAVEAVRTDNKQVTITLIDGNGDRELNGDGVKVQANQNIVIDFNDNTYDVDGKTVGSTGTETNGFQLLKGATVEMKNGTVTATASTAKLLIQKYCDLTLCDMVVDGTKLVGPAANYVISNNNGKTTFTGSTKVLAGEGDYAFDVYYWPANGYDEVKVVFADDFTGTIDGNIQYATDGTNNGSWYTKAILEINGNGTFNGKLDIDEETGYDALDANITVSGGTFAQEVPADYLAEDALYYKDASGNFVFMDKETAEEEGYVITLNGYGYTSLDAAVEAGAVAYIDKAEGIDVGYTDLQEALEAAEEGETVKLMADITSDATVLINKNVVLDLNRFTATSTASSSSYANFLYVENATNITIKNGTIVGAAGQNAIFASASNLTLDNVTIDAGKANAVGIVFYGTTNISAIKGDGATTRTAVSTEGFYTLNVNNSTVQADVYGIAGNGGKKNSGTIININNSTVETLTQGHGTAIFHPQYGILNVDGANTVIEGLTGIEMRAGELNVYDGTITSTLEEPLLTDQKNPGEGNSVYGAAVAISQHTTQLPVDVNVSGGTLGATYEGNYALYEIDLIEGSGTGDKDIITISLTGGTYNGEVYSENKTGFVSGGKYSTELDASLFAEGFSAQYLNGYYYALEESGSEGSGSLQTAKLEAQTDVRLYATSALGMSWNKLKTVDGAKDILKLYAAIENATGVGALTIAKTEAMNAVDAYLENVENARAAAVTAVQAAADDAGVTLPTAAYAAINGALTTDEVDLYEANALAEIEEIADLRADIAAQMTELQKVSSAVNKLSTAFTGTNNEFDALLKDIEDAIDAAQKEIVDGTSDSLTKMQAALEAKISAGDKAIESAIATLRTELSNYAAKVDTVKTELQASLTASTGALQTGVDALDEAIGAVQADIDALEAAIDAEGGNVEDLAADIAGVKTAVDGISASVESVVEDAQAALSQQIEDADDSSAFTVVYTLVGIALALAAAAVVLQVVTLFKRK